MRGADSCAYFPPEKGYRSSNHTSLNRSAFFRPLQVWRVVLFACVTFALACAPDAAKNNVAPGASAEIKPALDSVTSDKLLRHIKTLASDEFEGRAPGTKGEELTVNYLTG
jgi:hypothetical protein